MHGYKRTKSGFSIWCTIPAPVNKEPTVKEERRKNFRLSETGFCARAAMSVVAESFRGEVCGWEKASDVLTHSPLM